MRGGGALLVLALAIFGARADADEAPAAAPSPSQEAARGHYLAGKSYYAAGDYKRALGEFLAARTDFDRPELDYNIGLTYEQLGDAARAVAAYDRFSERRPNDDPAQATELARRVGALRARIGRILVTGRVPGSILTIDGERLTSAQRGTSLPITIGTHEITAAADGMFARTRRVDVTAGPLTRVELDPASLSSRRRLPGWAIGLITVGSVLVVGAVVTAAVVTTRPPDVVVGNTSPGTVTVRP